ncbi:MAG TPA: AraC family transcriptional regulator [Balneolaceae bacterium]|nr:AraC family transcriptional regulator [Balneolaceae bacterium]
MYLYQIQQRFEELLEDYKNDLPEPNVNQPEVIQYAIDFIYEHLFDQQLTVQWMNEHCNTYGDYYLSVFKFHVGCTPKYLWTKHRIEAAKILLKDKGLAEAAIGDVAFNLGYAAHATFSFVFKKYTGYVPKNFREKHFSLEKNKANKA